MKKYKDFGVYDFSDYAEEITGDALFKINGGAQVENSIEAQANAQVGDTLTRNDGTTVTLTQGDINWAKEKMGSNGNDASNSNTNIGNTAGGNSGVGQGNNSVSSITTTSIQTVKEENKWTFNPNEPDTDKRYNAKDVIYQNQKLHVMAISCDDAENFESFLNYYVLVGKDGVAGTTVYDGIGLMDKNGNVIQVLSDEKYIYNYARSLGIPINTDNQSDISASVSYGFKLALILGLGGEIGGIIDKSGNAYIYLSGSIGCGIQTPTTTKTNLSTINYLKKSVGPSGNITLDPNKIGTSSSLTADICLGAIGTYDLNNLSSSGLPNSWSIGSVGGGVWKTGTVVFPIYKKEP